MVKSFELVGERETEELSNGLAMAGPTLQGPTETSHSVELLALALKGLSQRAIIALSSLFTVAALFSVWWLFDLCLPEPSTPQLVGLSIYGLFVLLLEFVRRR